MMNGSVLMKADSKLIAVHEGKYYKRGDGLAVGPGCFTHGLEYATGKTAKVIGKPNPFFFTSAIPEGIEPHECCMIGDVSIHLYIFDVFMFLHLSIVQQIHLFSHPFFRHYLLFILHQ